MCPTLSQPDPFITLAHGSGGKLTHKLIEQLFLPTFSNQALSLLHDGAFLTLPHSRLAFTTDSYVIQPLFFPGGDIGKLAVTGTLNDLAMCGAKPYYLSCSLIIEEGLSHHDLKKIVESMQKEANAQGVQIVTGDTKVIERQRGGNLFINTTGLGLCLLEDKPPHALQIEHGDVLLLSNDIARHGMAILAEREKMMFSPPLMSDCASVFPLVEALIKGGVSVHCLRDLTRGGLATALIELAESSQKTFHIYEENISIIEGVRAACELLGFDPLYVANEGCFVVFLPQEQAPLALEILRSFPEGQRASVIGQVTHSSSPLVHLESPFGTTRTLFRLTGDQLPRIC